MRVHQILIFHGIYLLVGYKLKHRMELSVIAILCNMWIMHLMILVVATNLCIQASAVSGEVLPAARYIAYSFQLALITVHIFVQDLCFQHKFWGQFINRCIGDIGQGLQGWACVRWCPFYGVGISGAHCQVNGSWAVSHLLWGSSSRYVPSGTIVKSLLKILTSLDMLYTIFLHRVLVRCEWLFLDRLPGFLRAGTHHIL